MTGLLSDPPSANKPPNSAARLSLQPFELAKSVFQAIRNSVSPPPQNGQEPKE
jgi:hypothetical protein